VSGSLGADDDLLAALADEKRWREQDAIRLAALTAENDALKRRLAERGEQL
jgi:hypothetical protein